MAGAGHGDWPVKASRLCCRHPRIRSEKSWKIVVGPWPLVVGQAAMDSPTTKDQGRGSSAAARRISSLQTRLQTVENRRWSLAFGRWPSRNGFANDQRPTAGFERRRARLHFQLPAQTSDRGKSSLVLGLWSLAKAQWIRQRPTTKDQGPRAQSAIRYWPRARTNVMSSGCSLAPIQSSTAAVTISLIRARGW